MWLQQLLRSYRAKKIRTLILLLLLSIGTIVQAADTTYTTSVGVTDTVAPGPVSNLLANVDDFTITLTWNDAVDDQGIFQYVILRDGSEVGVSNSSTFVDTVNDSGEFQYEILSEDFGGNRSSEVSVSVEVRRSSSSGGGGGSGGTSLDVELLRVVQMSSYVAATIELTRASAISFSYGTTPDYELGTIQSNQAFEHELTLANLSLNDRYYFKLVAVDTGHVLRSGTFVVERQNGASIYQDAVSMNETTLGPILVVRRASLRPGDSIIVTYLADRPPLHRYEGEVIYRGGASAIQLPHRTGHYTVFWLNESGEMVQAEVVAVGSTAAGSVTDRRVLGAAWSRKITLGQTGSEVVVDPSTGATVYAGRELVVHYAPSVSELLDGVIATIEDKNTGSSTSYALVANTGRSGYSVTIPIHRTARGQQLLSLSVYQGREVITVYSTQLIAVQLDTRPPMTLARYLEELRKIVASLFQLLQLINRN